MPEHKRASWLAGFTIFVLMLLAGITVAAAFAELFLRR